MFSEIKHLGQVKFPEFSGVRVMMMPFHLHDITGSLPPTLAQYKKTIADICLLGPGHHGVGYLTIDEAIVNAGETHRRPGLHVDGIGPKLYAGSWGGGGSWGGSDNPTPTPPEPIPVGGWGGSGTSHAGSCQVKGMLVSANVMGSRGWHQEFKSYAGENGDCTHLANELDKSCEIAFDGNNVYWCSPLAVHESIAMKEKTARQFVRVSMPSNAPWYDGYTENPLGIKPTGPIHSPREEFMSYRK